MRRYDILDITREIVDSDAPYKLKSELDFLINPELGMQQMNLPSFLWLWKIAAWSMGFSLLAYLLLAVSGTWMFAARSTKQPRPKWLRPFHLATGAGMATLVILLLGIGVVGTLGEYGKLGHSVHLPVGLAVVTLVLVSVGSGLQISPKNPWARPLHIGANLTLFGGFGLVLLTGWTIVQKYLP